MKTMVDKFHINIILLMSSNYQVLNELTFINNAILLGNKKERNSNICYNMDELQQFMLVKVISHKRHKLSTAGSVFTVLRTRTVV